MDPQSVQVRRGTMTIALSHASKRNPKILMKHTAIWNDIYGYLERNGIVWREMDIIETLLEHAL